MKNYPLLPINFNAWKNWTHTYLTEIDNKVYSLFHYVNYFVPDYYKQNISEIIFDNSYNSITSQGHQYIDTGVVCSNTLRIECKFKITAAATSNSKNYICGAYSYNPTITEGDTNGNRIQFSYSQEGFCGWGTNHISPSLELDEEHDHIIILSKDGFVLDQSQTALYVPDSHDFTEAKNLYIFCNNSNGTPYAFSNGVIIYYFKIYDNDVLIRNFIPAEQDGKYGMFDLVTWTFYPNLSTGSFIVEDLQDIKYYSIAALKYHEYIVPDEEILDQLTQRRIHAGSRIVSKAQSEGELDLPSSANRQNPAYYFIQPTGWASFYIPVSNHAVPTDPEQGTEATDCLSFIYDAQAEEKYGLNLRFSIEWYPTRWYLDNVVTTSEYSGDGLVFSRNTTNRSISAQSTNGEKPIIRDLNGTEWLNGTDKRPMYSGFFGATNSEYGEEIIIDTIPSTATRFVETNCGVYTITLNKSTTHWPNSGLFLLY